MNITTLNASLLISWLLITLGTLLLNVGIGLIVSGITLSLFTLFLALRFGVFGAPAKTGDD